MDAMNKTEKGVLRNASFDDCIEASALLTRLGLIMPEGDEAVIAHFDRLWRRNPAMKVAETKPSLGWVLEDAGKMVGFFGNVPLLYEFDGSPVIVSDASQWGVEKEYRNETARLADAYFGQQGIDLLLVTTAIKPTSRIFERYGGTRLPQPGFDRVLYWVIDGGGFVRAGLRKKGLGPVYSWIVGTGGGILLNARMRLSGRRPFAPLDDITIITVDQIDEAFDALWQRKTGEYPGRLLARRDAESLRWHFEAGAAADQTRIICCRRDGQLEGYAVLIRDDAPGIGLKRFKIADLFAAGDEEKTVGALLTAAYEYSLAKRCHVLEIIGLPKRPRSLVLAHKPFHREMPTFPFYFKALREDLKKPLETEDGWYVTAFDGDTALL